MPAAAQKPPIKIALKNNESISFIHIPAGTFTFQKNKELEKKYTVPEFYMQQSLMTQGQYLAFMGHNPSTDIGKTLPVTNVSWLDVYEPNGLLAQLQKQVDAKISQQLQQPYTCRLANEVEWESVAAFAGKDHSITEYAGHSQAMPVAWFDMNSYDQPMPVASRLANDLGLYDLSGNVWEWCHNKYDAAACYKTDDYKTSFAANATMAIRGGAFWHRGVTVAIRDRGGPPAGYRNPLLGFRVCLFPSGYKNNREGLLRASRRGAALRAKR